MHRKSLCWSLPMGANCFVIIGPLLMRTMCAMLKSLCIMMRKNNFLSIKKIIDKMPRTSQYRQNWRKHNILVAWRHLFPHLSHEPKKVFLKEDVVYFQFASLLLANSLRGQQAMFVEKLQAELTKLDGGEAPIKGVVFL